MMQSLSFSQLKNFSEYLRTTLLGAQLQNVWTNGEIVFLELYLNREFVLAIDSKPQLPMIGILESAPKLKKQQKPVVLFLNSHAVNLRLVEIEVRQEWGRVIQLEFANSQKNCLIDVQLIPRAFNLLVDANTADGENKKIAWAKPKELPPSTATAPDTDKNDEDWWQFGRQWLGQRLNPNGVKNRSINPQDHLQNEIQKKQKVLANLNKNLQEEASTAKADLYRQLGERLKYATDRELPDELRALYNDKLSLSENRDKAFAVAKQIISKQVKIIERISALESEIAQMQSGQIEVKKVSDKKGLLEKSTAKGRRLKINEHFEAVIGKSGEDNLAILRKAQPWDLWLHLKDYPGSHAIISRPRNMEVPLSVLEQIAKWIIKESFSSKKIDLGQSYDVLVVETRFVRPIKGDKLGRVNFTNSKVYRFSS